MSLPRQWQRTGPRPDPLVLELIEQLKKAAEEGKIRALAVVTINPLLEVEKANAGDLDNVRCHLLIGGLSALRFKLEQEITE